MYWLSATSPGSLEATTIELPLRRILWSARTTSDRVDCGRSHAESAHDASGCVMLAFYLQPDGTAVRGFFGCPVGGDSSGIQNEQLVVDSIAQTLGANVNLIRQLKVLIHGQEAETLAGHLDLSGVFPVSIGVRGGFACLSDS